MADADPFDQPQPVSSADGTPLAAYELGGGGTDVLAVHATGFCAAVWGPLLDELRRRADPPVRAAALDLRGHGRSGVPAAGMHWDGTADDVLAVVEALGLRRPVGLGHSLGGASLLLAEQARPGTFGALWLFEPIVFDPAVVPPDVDDDANPLVRSALRRRPVFPSAEDALVNFAAKPPLSALAPAALEAYVRHGFAAQPDGTVTLRCRPEVEADTFRMGGRHRAWHHLGEVRCPVVVVRGRPEGPPAAAAPPVAARLAAGRLEEHPGLGHFGPLEDPAAMAASAAAVITAAVRGPA